MAGFPHPSVVSEPSFSYAEAAKGRRPQPKPVNGDQATESTASQSPSLNGTSETSITHHESAPEPQLELAVAEMEHHVSQLTDTTARAEDSLHKAVDLQQAVEPDDSRGQASEDVSEHVSSRSIGSEQNFVNGNGKTTEKDTSKPADQAQALAEPVPTEYSTTWDSTNDNEQKQQPLTLAAAPPPTINIWQQRREALYSKSASVAYRIGNPLSASSLEDPVQRSKGQSGDDQTKQTDQTSQELNGQSPPTEDLRNGNAGHMFLDSDASAKREENSSHANGVPSIVAKSGQSWPTPDHAIEESRKRAPDRSEKADKQEKEEDKEKEKAGNGKSKRKGWVLMDFVPSVQFQTPMPGPRRVGKYNNRMNKEEAPSDNSPREQNGNDDPRTGQSDQLGIKEPAVRPYAHPKSRNRFEPSTRGSPQGQSSPYLRLTTTDPMPTSESDRSTIIDPTDDHSNRIPDRSSHQLRSGHPQHAPRRISSATQTDKDWKDRTDHRQPVRGLALSHGALGVGASDTSGTTHRPPTTTRHRTNDTANAQEAGPYKRDAFVEPNGVGHPQRDYRGDKFFDRGRGTERRRGGGDRILRHQTLPSNIMTNGASVADLPFSHTISPTKQSSGFTAGQHPVRHHHLGTNFHRSVRGVPKSHSLPFSTMGHPLTASPRANTFYATSPQNPHYPSGYDYAVYPMMTEPFIYDNQLPDQQLFEFLRDQMDYYFGLDNLLKDMYLRKHMNDDGAVPLSFIARFNRIRGATSELAAVHMAAVASSAIEVFPTSDGIIWLRPRGNWKNWVLPAEQREKITPTEDSQIAEEGDSTSPTKVVGPSDDYAAHRHRTPTSEFGFGGTRVLMESHRTNGPMTNGHISIEQAVGLPLEEPGHPVIASEGAQLSATVPDFAPMALKTPPNQAHPAKEPESFDNTEIANLYIITRSSPKLGSEPSSPVLPMTPNAKMLDVVDQNQSSVNALESDPGSLATGCSESEHNEVGSKVAASVPSTPLENRTLNPHPRSHVRWVKSAPSQVSPLADGAIAVLYTDFRSTALQRRRNLHDQPVEPTMLVLYAFWAHFLQDNFNRKMYEEFKDLSRQDRETGNPVGTKRLASFYNSNLTDPRPISKELAEAYRELLFEEIGQSQQPALGVLKLAWSQLPEEHPNKRLLLSCLGSSSIAKELG